jgi:hypothetical protein
MRDRPHLLLGTPLRCCMTCAGQTRQPYPAPMIHEATCPRVRKIRIEERLERIAEQLERLGKHPDD